MLCPCCLHLFCSLHLFPDGLSLEALERPLSSVACCNATVEVHSSEWERSFCSLGRRVKAENLRLESATDQILKASAFSMLYCGLILPPAAKNSDFSFRFWLPLTTAQWKYSVVFPCLATRGQHLSALPSPVCGSRGPKCSRIFVRYRRTSVCVRTL